MAEFVFPEKFYWGAATSSHQVEGDNVLNDWWKWEKDGRVPNPSGRACSHYRLFQKDFELAKELGHNAQRFSIEWSRLEPQPGEWDSEAVRHYGEVIASLRSKGIEPIVTLHHFTNPVWFSEQGGWEKRSHLHFYERYVQKVVDSYGADVQYWITINEPLVYVFQSYLMGIWPPGVSSFPRAVEVCRNLLLAHQMAYRVIHKVSKEKWGRTPSVGIAKHWVSFTPCGSSGFLDGIATWLRHWFFNRFPLDSLVSGFLFFPGIFFEKLLFKGSLDFIGLNYYKREHIRYAGHKFPGFFGEVCEPDHHPAKRGRTDMGWEIHAKGLYHSLMALKRYRRPVMITENGLADAEDRKRWPFIQSHLLEMVHAMRRGVPVIGYLYWSLLDNFEWAEGYAPRFGLIEVDYATQQRRIRPSGRLFAQICLRNRMAI